MIHFPKFKGIVIHVLINCTVLVIFRLYVVEDCLEVDGTLAEADPVLSDHEM